jgi:multidrug efflux system membrane fusion protein
MTASLRFFVLVALVSLPLASCRKPEANPGPGGAAAGPPPAPVIAGQVVRKTVPLRLRTIGRVEPIATVAVRARVGGELTTVWFTEGAAVTRGQTLFTIDPRPYQAALAETEARLARNQALIKKAQIDAARYEGLVKQDYVTKEQFDQMVTNVAALEAQIAADQAAVDSARLNLSYCTIAAPVAGRTGTLMIKAGNLVRANDERAMVTINQTRPIYVAFTVPAQYLAAVQGRLRDGLQVSAFAPERPDQPFAGQLSFIDNAVDAATSTIQLKGTFENATEALWPGQFVSVVLTLGDEADRVVAPATAVQTSQQGQYVFVVGGDGSAELRPVKVNRQDETEAVIDSGLQGGETVVVEGHLRVVPGGKVAVRTAAGPGPGQGAGQGTPAGTGQRTGQGARP